MTHRLPALEREPARCGAVAHQQPPVVTVPSACPHRFRLVPCGAATRWARERGLARALRSANGAFDARWALETEDVEFGEALLRRAEARAAVTALAELGLYAVTHDGRRLHATLGARERRRIKEPERKAAIEAQLRALDALCRELNEARHYPRRTFHRRLFAGLLIGALALGAAAMAGIVHWSRDLVDGELAVLALRSLAAGLPIGLVIVAACVASLAGRTTSHKEAALLLVLGLPAVVGACTAGALALNRALDPGPVVHARVPVLELRERHGGEGKQRHVTGYWAIVPSWHGTPEDTERIALGRERGAAVEPGRTMLDLQWSPGALGAARLLGVAIE